MPSVTQDRSRPNSSLKIDVSQRPVDINSGQRTDDDGDLAAQPDDTRLSDGIVTVVLAADDDDDDRAVRPYHDTRLSDGTVTVVLRADV